MARNQSSDARTAMLTIVMLTIVACGGGDSTAPVVTPPVIGKRVVFITDSSNAPRTYDAYVTDTAGNASTPTRLTFENGAYTAPSSQMQALISPSGSVG